MVGKDVFIIQNTMTMDRNKRLFQFLLIMGIIFIAFNLRPAITSVGPVIGIIRDDIGLSNWSAGILTSLPLIAFAVVSPLAPRLANRYSNEWALLIGLIVLFIGINIRSIPFVSLLFIGTLFVGLGIAICNVLLPGLIKAKFPEKVSIMTGVYSASMGTFASAASGLSIPFAEGLGLGWQITLMIWSIPAIIGIIIWIYLSKKSKPVQEESIGYISTGAGAMWRSPLAWQIAAFMGFQSFLFYVTISWLPEILQAYGVDIGTAGWMLSFVQLIGLPFSFIIPVIAGRFKSQWLIVIILGIFAIGGYTGLLVGNSYIVMIISIILIGIALGGIFPLCLALLAMRARNAKQAADLSGMAQSLGYLLAAIGPMLIGYLYDLTDSWEIPLLTLIVVAIIVIIFGSLSGRNRYV